MTLSFSWIPRRPWRWLQKDLTIQMGSKSVSEVLLLDRTTFGRAENADLRLNDPALFLMHASVQ